MLFEVSPPVAKHSGCERASKRASEMEKNIPNGKQRHRLKQMENSRSGFQFLFLHFVCFVRLIFRTLNCDTGTRNCWDAPKWKIALTQLALQQEPTKSMAPTASSDDDDTQHQCGDQFLHMEWHQRRQQQQISSGNYLRKLNGECECERMCAEDWRAMRAQRVLLLFLHWKCDYFGTARNAPFILYRMYETCARCECCDGHIMTNE